jgi:hypothetical protein
VNRTITLVARFRPRGLESALLEEALSVVLLACHTLARELEPFLPAASARIRRALAECNPELGRRLFAKVELPA